jgi:hypothetical protein
VTNRADREALLNAIRHCESALTALRVVDRSLDSGRPLYPTHLYLAAAELAKTSEIALRVALRNQ